MGVKQLHLNFMKLIWNTHSNSDSEVDFIDLPSSALQSLENTKKWSILYTQLKEYGNFYS